MKFTLGGIFWAVGVACILPLIDLLLSGGIVEGAHGIGVFVVLFGGVGAVMLVLGIHRWRMLRDVFRRRGALGERSYVRKGLFRVR